MQKKIIHNMQLTKKTKHLRKTAVRFKDYNLNTF